MALPRLVVVNNRYFQWLLVQGFFCLNLIGVVVYVVTAASLGQSLKLSSLQISSIGGAYFVAYAMSQLLLGSSLELVPPRLLLGVTAIVAGGGGFALSAAQSYEQVLVARLLMAVGFGTAMVGVVRLIGQRFGQNFAFMVNLSQGLGNVGQTTLGLLAPLPIFQDFRAPFAITAGLLVINGLLILIFYREPEPELTRQELPTGASRRQLGLGRQLATIVRSGQFWIGTIFFTGLFGTFLAYADLWNVRFQADVFGRTPSMAAFVNAGVQGGLAIGGILTGLWAARSGFLPPARTCSWLSLVLLLMLYSVRLPDSVAISLMVLLGMALGAAPLGLAVMNAHLPEQVQGLATPILLTIVFIGAGVLMSSVGVSLAPLSASAFSTYRMGLNWFLVPVAVAGVASLLMKSGRARGS